MLNVLNLPDFAGVEDQSLKALLSNLVLEVYKRAAEEKYWEINERHR